ncbi:MAG: TIR domain-containing protein [Pseudomonadota bacterium]
MTGNREATPFHAMAEIDVFISYKREERDLADTVARALKDAGYVAVTDLNIQKGTDFGEAIDRMIREAKVVVVLWTHASVASPWVRKEAEEAEQQGGKYLGVLVEPVTAMDLPIYVRRSNWLDLSGTSLVDGLPDLLEAVTAKAGMASRTEEEAEEAANVAEGDLEFYQVVHSVGELSGYKKYVATYPDGTYVTEARGHIQRLSRWYGPVYRWPVIAALGTAAAVLAAVGTITSAPPEYQELKEMEAEVARLTGELTTTRTALGTAEADAKGAAARVTEIETARVMLEQEYGAADARVAELDAALEAARSELAEATERLTGAENKLAETGADLESSLSTSEKLQADLRSAEVRATDASASAAELQKKLVTAQTDLAAAQAQLAALREEAAEKAAPVSDCKEQGEAGIRIGDRCVPLNTTKLDLSGTSISDVSTLSGLTGLKTLYLSDTSVSDVRALSSLTGLESLSLSGTSVSDVRALSGLKGLRWLSLSRTSVSDARALSGLTGLETLYLTNTSVSDVSALSGLTGLETLYLSNTPISDVSVLSGLEALHRISLPDGTTAGDSYTDTPENRVAVQEAIANWRSE